MNSGYENLEPVAIFNELLIYLALISNLTLLDLGPKIPLFVSAIYHEYEGYFDVLQIKPWPDQLSVIWLFHAFYLREAACIIGLTLELAVPTNTVVDILSHESIRSALDLTGLDGSSVLTESWKLVDDFDSEISTNLKNCFSLEGIVFHHKALIIL